MITPNNSNGNLKIMVLGDDFRLFSGVGTIMNRITKAFRREDWDVVSIAAAVQHPDLTPLVDEFGRKLYPHNGYGDIHLVRQLIKQEKPDIMWIQTDPRYWVWLWSFSSEFRDKIPLLFYHVWDAPPCPKYNYDFYNSCDSLLCISKLTYNIVTQCKKDTNATFNVIDCPHGIDTEIFKPIPDELMFKDIAKTIQWDETGKKGDEPEEINIEVLRQRFRDAIKPIYKDADKIKFFVFWHNKNMRRKNAPMMMEAFTEFAKGKDDVMLIMHTEIATDHGTQLEEVRKNLFPESPILLFPEKVPEEELVKFFVLASVTCNIASAEGFGLASAESMACGTPIINNMCGGLADQMYVDGDKDKACGIPIEPLVHNLVGSVPTPFLYDIFCSTSSVVDSLEEMYEAFNKKEEKNSTYRQWQKNCRDNVIKNFNTLVMEKQHTDEIKRLVREFVPIPPWEISEV